MQDGRKETIKTVRDELWAGGGYLNHVALLNRHIRLFPTLQLFQIEKDTFFSLLRRADKFHRAGIGRKEWAPGGGHGPNHSQSGGDLIGTRLPHPSFDQHFPAS